ncbi:MAG: hypothetical protein KAT68_15205 [Bacteroidales bacterium]|nr:hypothetical protein [Bacteroidales bacterium]
MKRHLLSFLIITNIIFVIISCDHKLAYKIGSTDDINESKSRKVFINEYNYIVTDSVQDYFYLNFSEIYLEKLWKYGRKYEETILKDDDLQNKYQLVFKYQYEDNIASYYKRIYIESDTNTNNIGLYISGHGLLTSNIFDSSFINDTIRFNVLKTKSKEVIGQLVLIKK